MTHNYLIKLIIYKLILNHIFNQHGICVLKEKIILKIYELCKIFKDFVCIKLISKDITHTL